MIKRKQIFRHDPANGTFGDCHRTCIACLLDLEPEQVPHWGVHYHEPEKFNAMAQEFLKTQGLMFVTSAFGNCSVDDLLCSQGKINPGAYYLLTGKSARGCNHVVICLNDKIVHDPHPSDVGITGPTDEGWYWIDYLVPLRFTERAA